MRKTTVVEGLYTYAEFGARTEALTKPGLAVSMVENEFRRAKAALSELA